MLVIQVKIKLLSFGYGSYLSRVIRFGYSGYDHIVLSNVVIHNISKLTINSLISFKFTICP